MMEMIIIYIKISVRIQNDGDFKINDGDDHHRSSLSQKDNLPP